MPYAGLYNKLIVAETNIAKNRIKPRNIYKIITYEYADGTVKSLTGPKSAIVFVLGITPDRKLSCLKISEVQPIKFFNWLKLNLKRGLTESQIDEALKSNEFDTLVQQDNKIGSKIFSKTKTNSIYQQQPGSYRTYFLTSIKLIKQISLEPKEIKKYINIKREPEQPQS